MPAHPGQSILSVALGVLLVACAPAPALQSGTAGPSSAGPTRTVQPTGTAIRPTPTQAQPPPAEVALQTVVEGLSTPLALVTPPDGSGRLFVAEQTGKIRILDSGALRPQPFLDLGRKLVQLDTGYDERGLLGLAFHPQFRANGRFFVYYSAPLPRGPVAGLDHTNTLSEFRVSAGDRNRADAASERKLLQFEQPQPNHSGGALGFGPDGFLYLGAGDGGGQGDASFGHSKQGNAQDTQKLNGKILRIDVNRRAGSTPYSIPADNPFARGGGRAEIYAYGLRNPWRLSWEPSGERRLLVSDVGYGRYEEIDVIERGRNYGWRIREGRHCLNVAAPLQPVGTCPTKDDRGQALIEPVVEYSHQEVGVAVVGGYRYRGSALTKLRDQYVFADFSAEWTNTEEGHGSLMTALPVPGLEGPWPWRVLEVEGGTLDFFITGMGEDAGGELYVLARTNLGPRGDTGRVLKIVPAPSST